PRSLHSILRPWWRRFFRFGQRVRGWIPWAPFIMWLVLQCVRHRKKAVIICRCGALGDVVCTLPMCGEIRKRHPRRLIIFVTAAAYRDMVLLSRAAGLVFGSRSWVWPFSMPENFNV